MLGIDAAVVDSVNAKKMLYRQHTAADSWCASATRATGVV